MVWVALSLGSNERPRENLGTCLDMLLLQFHDLALSSVFESEAVDQPGQQYLNMAVGFETTLPLADLVAQLKRIEDRHGRRRGPDAGGRVSLDIDLMLYGDQTGPAGSAELPHPDIARRAYMLWPLSQIAGTRQHPALGRSYRSLWQEFDRSTQAIRPVPFDWHGRTLTVA
jgi:2-amino-4-hydroxy-6-hydroxymethyldihydropteridine diphosphokinase